MKIPTRATRSEVWFSDCGYYRYSLSRHLHGTNPSVANFIMLNPSTACIDFNDPTLDRCETRAIAGGFTEMVITNLFAYCTDSPKELKRAAREGVEVIGTQSQVLVETAKRADLIICAWGNDGAFRKRSSDVLAMLQPFREKLHYLQMNDTGQPAHPLYLDMTLLPQPWLPSEGA